MALTNDQEVVETLPPHHPYKSLGERVRLGCLNRSADDSDVLGPEHLVERTGEFGVSVPDHDRMSGSRSPTATLRPAA